MVVVVTLLSALTFLLAFIIIYSATRYHHAHQHQHRQRRRRGE